MCPAHHACSTASTRRIFLPEQLINQSIHVHHHDHLERTLFFSVDHPFEGGPPFFSVWIRGVQLTTQFRQTLNQSYNTPLCNMKYLLIIALLAISAVHAAEDPYLVRFTVNLGAKKKGIDSIVCFVSLFISVSNIYIYI